MVGPSGDATVGCPHCGGAIKPTARLCKHCRRSVEQRHDNTPIPAAAPAVPQLPPVLLDLRVFLASKKLVDVAKVDYLLATRNTNDAAALLRQLAVLGSLTQVQADSLIGEFQQRQMTTARAAIETARTRGLIPASHVEQAIASYAPMAFTVSIHDHLVGCGLLTPEQVNGLPHQRTGGSVSRRWLLLVAVGVAVVVIATRGGCGDRTAKQGERMQAQGVAITVVRSIVVNSYNRHLVKVIFKVENTGKTVVNDLRSRWFVLEDAQGHQFKPVRGYDVENLQPLDIADYALLYELPSAADRSRLVWGAVIESTGKWGINCTLDPETMDRVPPGFEQL